MAAPQFFVPPRVRPSSRPKQVFSLRQANRALPYVQRVVSDIVRTHELATHQQTLLDELAASASHRGSLESAISELTDRLSELLDELADVGCDCKDFQIGLVDFIGRHKGRDVCLCWKLGEDKIGYWHELQSGFSGRQPVSMLDERE